MSTPSQSRLSHYTEAYLSSSDLLASSDCISSSYQTTVVDEKPVSRTNPHPRALDVPEVVLAIFDQLDPQPPVDLSACSRASRVCRAFSEPASKVIWGRLMSLGPLWNALSDGEVQRHSLYPGYCRRPDQRHISRVLRHVSWYSST